MSESRANVVLAITPDFKIEGCLLKKHYKGLLYNWPNGFKEIENAETLTLIEGRFVNPDDIERFYQQFIKVPVDIVESPPSKLGEYLKVRTADIGQVVKLPGRDGDWIVEAAGWLVDDEQKPIGWQIEVRKLFNLGKYDFTGQLITLVQGVGPGQIEFLDVVRTMRKCWVR